MAAASYRLGFDDLVIKTWWEVKTNLGLTSHQVFRTSSAQLAQYEGAPPMITQFDWIYYTPDLTRAVPSGVSARARARSFDTRSPLIRLIYVRARPRACIFLVISAKSTFVSNYMICIFLRSMNIVPNGSRGHPESVAPEFVGRNQLKVKTSPPKVGEICRDRIWSHFSPLVLVKWGNVRTCMTRLAGVWRLGRCGIDSGRPR
jgi:hypothetical protein